MFSYPLYLESNVLLSSKIKDNCYSILKEIDTKNNDKNYKFGKTSWFDTKNLNHESLSDLKKYILEQFKIFANFLKIKRSYEDFQITQLWISELNKYGSHEYHTHSNSFISGTFYVHVDEDSSEIRFYRPDYNSINFQSANEYDKYNSLVWDIKPANGLLLMWHSSLPHAVLINESSSRVSISFNINLSDSRWDLENS